MRNRWVDPLIAAAFVVSLSATLVLGHRDRMAAAARQQRQAAVNAGQARVTASIEQMGTYQAAHRVNVLVDRFDELNSKLDRLGSEQIALLTKISQLRRLASQGVVSPDLGDLEAKADAHELVFAAALQRANDAAAAGPGPLDAYLAESNRLFGNTQALTAQQAKLVAAMAAGDRAPPSRLRPWAMWMTILLPAAWLIRMAWFRRRRLGRLRDRRCVVCDYDLQASPDRCPECGTVPPSAALA